MTKTKKIYYSLLLLVVFITSTVFFSYAFFTNKKESHGKLNIVAGTLDYKLESNDLKNNKISVLAGQIKKINIKVTSLNDITSKYELYYTSNDNNNLEVGYSIDSNDKTKGEISANSKKTITVIIKNNSDNDKEITFGVQGGLKNNNLVLNQGASLNNEITLCNYEAGEVFTFDYTGDSQQFTTLCEGNYQVELWGASGGDAYYNFTEDENGNYIPIGDLIAGGLGGYTSGTITLNEAENLYLYVGGKGLIGQPGVRSAGGYNGGGLGPNSYQGGASGGGATDIRLLNGEWSTFSSLKMRIMVAGAGGGTSNFRYSVSGGAGGGLIGYSGILNINSNQHTLATGGTQILGGTPGGVSAVGIRGTLGVGGNSQVNHGSGGGSGYYGGGGSGAIAGGVSSGAGGSSFISGHNGCDVIKEESTESNIIHSGKSIHYSKYAFTDTVMIDGMGYNWTTEKGDSVVGMPTHDGSGTMIGNQGNGYAKITYLGPNNSYKEELLNGTDPVLTSNLVPIKIADNGTVTKANLEEEWYSYEKKNWANAVVLKDTSVFYKVNEEIPEENIESYFVWIPKYSYQLWDLGDYSSFTSIDSTKPHAIPIRFGLNNTSDANTGECTTPMSEDGTQGLAGESGNCQVGDYMTHPAFLAFDTNGFWVGKFETGYDGATSASGAQVNSNDSTKIIIKPNVYSWRGITLGNAFKVSYDYLRDNDSHMMKNTEWGAVAYLQYSDYGSATSVRINNNKNYITGYASIDEPTLPYNDYVSVDGNRLEGTSLGIDGEYTVNYLNDSSNSASTTGNKNGIYDVSGGAYDYVMGYNINATVVGGLSEIISIYSDFFTNSKWYKYYDEYSTTISTNYNNRILGDATGEMGPFLNTRSSWQDDFASFISSTNPWFFRGGDAPFGTDAGMFSFRGDDGDAAGFISFRIVLAP